MVEPPSNYAPDLEWMLQSGQASPELLLEALIHEFYAPVFRLAFAVLDDRRLAGNAANEAFSRALAELYRYRSQDGVEIWLFRIALEACERIRRRLQLWRTLLAWIPFLGRPNDFGDSLPKTEGDAEIWLCLDRLEEDSRQVAILYFYLTWDVARIATLKGEPEENIQTILEMIRRENAKAQAGAASSPNHAPQPGKQDLDNVLRRSLHQRWPVPETSQHDLNRLIGRINRRARLIGHRKQGLVSLMEVALVSLIVLVGVGIVWDVNQLSSAAPSPSPTQAVKTVLITQIVYNYITATPTPMRSPPQATSISPVAGLKSYQYIVVHEGDTLQSLGKQEGVSPEALRKINRLPEDAQLESGQRLLDPGYWDILIPDGQLSFDSIQAASSMQPPYLSEKILQRIAVQGQRYNSLWIDAQIIDYGPGSYIGPPRLLHAQIWESKTYSLSLIGYPGQLPSEAVMHNLHGIFLAWPANDIPWFSEWHAFGQYDSPTLEELGRMSSGLFGTPQLERGYTFEVTGRENQAGVRALVFDVRNPGGQLTDRIWYDEQRGLILRRIEYLPSLPDEPMFEVQANQVVYDAAFPAQFFDEGLPWRGGFAQDVTGAPASLGSERHAIFMGRKPLAGPTPPPDFDPATSLLTFQYPPSYPFNASSANVKIFGDSFLLGNVFFGNPWTTICDRSPDGKWIAYVSQPYHSMSGTSRLQWFNLTDLDHSTGAIGTYPGVTAFAFSPDSQKLAYFNRPGGDMGALSVFDIPSRENRALMVAGDIKSLVWKPDGSSLGMIARLDPGSYIDYVVVYDLMKDKITYSAPVDYQSNAYGDWPMINWGVEFPVEMGGMDECARPPAAK